MLTLTDLLTEYLDVTNDDSAANKARGIRRMNQYQKEICSAKDYPWLYREFTLETVANQKTYYLPMLMNKELSVRVRVDSQDYPVDPIFDPRVFDALAGLQGDTYTSEYPSFYHVRGREISFYPIPSTSDYTIKIAGTAKPEKMTVEDYSTGTISVTVDSKTVTGSGTSWLANTAIGAYIFINNIPYQIAAIASDTSLTLTNIYQGSTASGLSYKIGDCPLVHEDYQDILWVRAARFKVGMKKSDPTAFAMLEREERRLENALESSTNSTSALNVWSPHKRIVYRSPNDYPLSIG